MSTWQEFVKEVRQREGVSYKEALKIASPLWKAKKAGKEEKPAKKKTRKKAKKVEAQPSEEKDFPKPKKPLKKVRIAKTDATPVVNLGGSLVPEDKPVKKPRGKRRLRKKRSINYDPDALFLKNRLRI